MCTHITRGYRHGDPETDSDGDGGIAPKLSGLGHIEFSPKGIPHGSLHFPEQLKWAGHIHMHNTEAPEASHRLNIKKAMDRVRKEDDTKTASSMIGWILKVRAWGKIISEVTSRTVTRTRKNKSGILNDESKLLIPTPDVGHLLAPMTFSPLRAGADNSMSPDVRISYHEVICTHICALIYERSHICTHICAHIYIPII